MLNNEEDGLIENCVIENMRLKSSNIDAGFVGMNAGKITNNRTTLSVNSKDLAGGFCSSNSGEIIFCDSESSVKANSRKNVAICGGFVGENSGIIKSCSSTGGATGQEYVGGFCGKNSGEIVESKTESDVIASTKININICGGFAGENSGIIKDCSSTGNTKGQEYVGGFAGINKAEINSCHAYGKAIVTAEAYTTIAGGFVGENEEGTIVDCAATGEARSTSNLGNAKAGGFVAINKAIITNSKANCYVYLRAGILLKENGCGGFVGMNDKNGNINKCYAESTVDTSFGLKGGGFVGEAKNYSTIKNSQCKTYYLSIANFKCIAEFCNDKSQKAIIEHCNDNTRIC